jgi:outer membrane protein assembly factor BamB
MLCKIKPILLIAFLALSVKISAQTVTQFRGPARDGIYKEANLMKSWPADGPTLLWKATGIGNGYSSPVISGDRIYVTGEIDSIGYLFAFNKSGTLIWKTETGREWMENFTGSRSTPTLVDGLLYVSTGMGNIICFDANSGIKCSKTCMA